MKLLRTEFVANYDKCGDNKFIQVKLTDKSAVYRREYMDGRLKSFEVFKIKVVEAGAPLPNGKVVEESYVVYPGGQSFGKTAWEYKNLAAAMDKFNELEAVVKQPVVAGVKGKRGRQAVARPDLIFPNSHFTMNDILKLNVLYSKPTMYVTLSKLLANGKLKVVDKIRPSNGRGKAMNVFSVA